MRKILNLIMAGVLFSSLVACGGKQFSISGTLENGANKVIFIEELTPEGPLFLDSITLDSKGHFEYSYEMPYKTFYNLHVSGFDYVVLLPDFGEKIELTGDFNDLISSYMLKGAGDSQMLWQLQKYTNDGIVVLKQLGSTDAQNKQLVAEGKMTETQFAAAHATLDSIYLATYHEQQAYVMNFIKEHKGSLATIIALYKPFNSTMPLIEPEYNFDYYQIVLEGLEENLPDNPHTLNFKNTVEHLRYQFAPEQQPAIVGYEDVNMSIEEE